jgi:hypothetical protein
MDINKEIVRYLGAVHSGQTKMTYSIFYTRNLEAEYCDEPGMKPLGLLHIDLPGSGLGRRVLFGLTFGKMEITATSKDEQTGQNYKAVFKYSLDD